MAGDGESEDDLRKAWREYKVTRSAIAREHLILHYVPLAKRVAGRVAAAHPVAAEQLGLEEFEAFGMFGLIDAIDHFALDGSVSFETFAIPRLKGAIEAELRARG